MIDHGISKDLFKGTGITQIVSGLQDGVIWNGYNIRRDNFSLKL
jgi:hypothetical protein